MLAESIGVSFAPNYGPSISSEQKLRKGASILCQALDRLQRDRQFLDEKDVISLLSRFEELHLREQGLQNSDDILRSVNPITRRKNNQFKDDAAEFLRQLENICAEAKLKLLKESWESDGSKRDMVSNSTPEPTPEPIFPPAPPVVPAFSGVLDVAFTPVPGAAVEIGSIQWGEDIDGEVRGLISLLPRGYSGGRIRARKTNRDGMVVVHFASTIDAITFDNSWNAQVPKGFESVSVQLSTDL